MRKPTSVQPAISLSQADRLARKERLDRDVAMLELQIRTLREERASLLSRCDHTDANGRSAVVGGRTKVCAHCGQMVTAHAEKLWQ